MQDNGANDNEQNQSSQSPNMQSIGATPENINGFVGDNTGISTQTPSYTGQPEQVMISNEPCITWTASEYEAEDKPIGWFAALAAITILIAGLVYLITGGDMVSSIVIIVLGISLGSFSTRKPETLTYALDSTGIHVGNKLFTYGSFKWFSVIQDGNALNYLYLMPLKRFMPPLTIHYEPGDEDRITQALSEYLPYENHKLGIVDSIAKKFRI